MSQFLLPCPECQTKVAVSRSQAGMSLNCVQCGKGFDVPKIRELALLEPVVSQSAKVASETSANPILKALSILFLLVGVCSNGYGAYLFAQRANVKDRLELTEEDFIQDIKKSMENQTPADTWDTWNDVSTNGIADAPIPDYFQMQRYFAQQRPIMLRSLGLGVVGILGFLVCAFLSRNKKPGESSPRAA